MMNAAFRWFLTLAAVAAAQPVPNPDPWRVTVVPTLNPLAVGFCSAVQVTVFEGAGTEVPRNPTGFRVTMADFDMAVNGASVMGSQIDPAHWQVCACQGGSSGTVATITATYPAKALSTSSRVPGVAFQRTATFALSEKKGSINPPACLTAGRSASAAASTAAVAPAPATPAVPTINRPIPGSAAGVAPARTVLYVPGPVTVRLALNAGGLWYEPGPVTMMLSLNARGLWYEPGPVTLKLALSATGTWIERTQPEIGTLQPAP